MSRAYFYIPTKKQIVGDDMDAISLQQFIKGEVLASPMNLTGAGDPTPINEAIERDWVRVDLSRKLPDVFVSDVINHCRLCGRNELKIVEADGVITDLVDLVAYEYALTYTWNSVEFIEFVFMEYGEEVAAAVKNRQFILMEAVIPGGDCIYIDAVKTSKGLVPIAKMLEDFRYDVRYNLYLRLAGGPPGSLSKMSLD